MPQDNQFASVAPTDKACNPSVPLAAEKLKSSRILAAQFGLNVQTQFCWYNSNYAFTERKALRKWCMRGTGVICALKELLKIAFKTEEFQT